MRSGIRRTLGGVVAVTAIVLVVASNPRTTRSACTASRSRVETLSDLDRRDVRFTPVPSTVVRLRRVRDPAGDTPNRRAVPVETTTYRVSARLVAMRRRRDADITLAISAPNDRSKTMLVTFPSTRCRLHTAKTRRAEIMRSTRTLVSACGKPTRRGVGLSGTAVILGVGLFDGHTGRRAAPNGVKLAPVLRFEHVACRRARAGPAVKR
jgi:hypothetical protein